MSRMDIRKASQGHQIQARDKGGDRGQINARNTTMRINTSHAHNRSIHMTLHKHCGSTQFKSRSRHVHKLLLWLQRHAFIGDVQRGSCELLTRDINATQEWATPQSEHKKVRSKRSALCNNEALRGGNRCNQRRVGSNTLNDSPKVYTSGSINHCIHLSI